MRGGEADPQPCCVDELATTTNGSETGRLSDNSGSPAIVQEFQVAPSKEMANQVSEKIQSSVDFVANNKSSVGCTSIQTVLTFADAHEKVEATKSGTQPLIAGPPAIQNSTHARVGAITQSSSQAPGLEASMWASKPKTLRDLPGLRQGRSSTATWDDSGYYSSPQTTGQRLSLNMLHQHAWNGGGKPPSSKNMSTSANAATPQPSIRSVGPKDAVTAARPTTDQNGTIGMTISERVPNTPRVLIQPKVAETTKPLGPGVVKTPQKSGICNVADDKPSNERCVPPHLRIPEPQTQILEPKEEQNTKNKMASPTAKPLDSTKYREHDVESPSSIVPLSPAVESSRNGQSQGNPEASACGAESLTLATTMTGTAIIVDQHRQDLDDPKHKLAPHLRLPKSRAMPALAESQPAMQDQPNAQVTKANSEEGPKKAGINGVFKTVSPQDKSTAANHQKNATDKNDIVDSIRTLPHNGSKSKKKEKDNQNPNDVNGWDKPIQTAHPLLGWDNKRVEGPEDWEGRSRQPIPAKEQMQALESWAEASESAFHGVSAYIDTAQPGFALGTGVIHDGSLSTGLSDQAHFTRRLPNDPLTHAKAEQTAQSKIEEHMAKRQEETPEPPVRKLTKQEQRQLRRELRERDAEFAKIPNPYKPKADIYIRPAQPRDLPQIVEIYNHYVETSAVALELDALDQNTWRLRMEDCRGEGYDMYVAVQKSGQGNGRYRRDHCEPIFGFAYAEEQNHRRSSCRYAALAQVYVSWKHLRIGVGRCLLDRVMAMLNLNHHHKQGVDWIGEPSLKHREVKKVLIEIPYWDDSEEERAIFKMEKNETTGLMERVPGWKAKFLENVQFEYAATLKEIGFKQAKLEKGKR